MQYCMGAFEKRTSSRNLLLTIEAMNDSLHIYDDGRAILRLGSRSVNLGRQIGRYALRRLYLGSWGELSDAAGVIRSLASELERCRRCQRVDCGSPIPAERQLKAFDRDTPAKWCSIRCQRTESTRRYLARRRR